jgi:hypothetical protein
VEVDQRLVVEDQPLLLDRALELRLLVDARQDGAAGAVLRSLWSGLDGASAWPAALAGTAWTAVLLLLLWPGVRRRLAEG